MKQILTKQNPTFWQKFFGEKLYHKLLSEQSVVTVEIRYQQESEQFLKALYQYSSKPLSKEYAFLEEEVFAPFYIRIIDMFLLLNPISGIVYEILFNAKLQFKKLLFERIREIPLRVCIYNMHKCKETHQLHGNDIEQEYQYYCEEKLSNGLYVWGICSEYKEMTRLLYARFYNTFQFVERLAEHIIHHKSAIVNQLCMGKEFHKVTELLLKGTDSHNHGQKTVRCRLDNGKSILYKPHTMKKELAYQQLFGFFSRNVLDSVSEEKQYAMIEGDFYGFSEYLERQECVNCKEAAQYFQRMGIHLFLCYLLHAGDMHFENIIALGAFPMLIDVETIPGICAQIEVCSVEDKIKAILGESVLKTGILPVPIWKNDEKGVILSALCAEGDRRSSVRLPVIRNGKTSEMYVEYEYVTLSYKGSIPMLFGKAVNPIQYTDELCKGFAGAYNLYMQKKENADLLIYPLFETDMRYLTRHTQQYQMFWRMSLIPMFLTDSNIRQSMLQILQKHCNDINVIKRELSAMMEGDIPYLTCGTKEYLFQHHNTAYQLYNSLSKNLDNKDLDRQLAFIKLSMELMDFTALNNEYFLSESLSKVKTFQKKKIEDALYDILQKIEQKAVWFEKDVAWITLKAEGESLWSLEPAGMDLYNGIGGIAVFFALICNKRVISLKESIIKMYSCILKKLYFFVDNCETDRNGGTGLLIGESSIAYTFLLLYRITGDIKCLEYAKKQAKKIEYWYINDKKYNLLYGNAGAVVMLMELYQTTKETYYADLAVLIGDWLWERAEAQNVGYGWRISENRVPLNGMAHGNSGFIYAYAYLLEYTHDFKYQDIIDKLVVYENSLFVREAGNWKVLRDEQKEVYRNAWCYGAAGILVSRLKLFTCKEYKENCAIQQNIQDAVKVLFGHSERRGLCLCHGMCGNYRIMRMYQQFCGLNNGQKKQMEYLKNRIVELIVDGKMLPQDRNMVGLMTGLSGIGICLVDILEDEI